MYTYSQYTELTPRNLSSSDVDIHSINLTWSPLDTFQAATHSIMQIFNLSITNSSGSHVLSLNESHYLFSAPGGVPPCEVYNFSVTATYVGATYTGAGCSVPSPVLTRMLPSLPDITGLKNSCINLLTKQPSGGVTLNVTFQVLHV